MYDFEVLEQLYFFASLHFTLKANTVLLCHNILELKIVWKLVKIKSHVINI